MIDHVSLRVSDAERAVAFFKAALAPLGYSVAKEFPGVVGFSDGRHIPLWVTVSDRPINPVHLALRTDRAGVRAFYAAALAAGGSDDGAPGPRPQYHANYYGAFVRDPDGNSIEAVCHEPAGAAAKSPAGAKPTAKKPTGNKAATKRPAAKKPTGNKAATKRPAAKKPTRKKAATKRAATKTPAAKRPAAKKATVKRTAATSPARKGGR